MAAENALVRRADVKAVLVLEHASTHGLQSGVLLAAAITEIGAARAAHGVTTHFAVDEHFACWTRARLTLHPRQGVRIHALTELLQPYAVVRRTQGLVPLSHGWRYAGHVVRVQDIGTAGCRAPNALLTVLDLGRDPLSQAVTTEPMHTRAIGKCFCAHVNT